MAYFRDLPFTTLSQLNLDWLIKGLQNLETDINNFVALNTIKYANPFDWDITTQYAMNTLVFNPADYTAYLSVKPVPSGVQIDNTDYWTPVFTLEDVLTAYRDAISPVFEQAGSPASTNIQKGQLFWIESGIYSATSEIKVGDTVAVGTNCNNTNISAELLKYVNAITAEQTAREEADSALQDAITAEQTAREEADSALQDSITAEQTAREEADSALQNAINNIPGAAFVNVADYGTKADANVYDNITRLWWKDNSKSVKPTNDSEAFQSAISDCLLQNKAILYIPSGNYYLGDAALTINASKIMVVCGSNVNLISEGLSEGAFITFTTDSSSSTYSPISEFCKNLNIYGNYSENKQSPSKAITGFLLSKNCYFTHASFSNCKAACFNNGLVMTNGSYKFAIYNFTAQACDAGVRCQSDYSSTIPVHFYNLSCDCCNTGLLVEGSGGTRVFVIGGTFEYNRFAVNSNGLVSFSAVRFEFDGTGAMTDSGAAGIPFTANNADQSALSFTDCTFFMLSHYAANVAYWWPSASVASNMPSYIFVNYSTSAIFAALSFVNCIFTSDQTPTNGYLATTVSGAIYASGFSHPSGQKYTLSTQNNIISNNISNLDPRFVNMTATAVGSDYGFQFGNDAGIKIPVRAGDIVDFILDVVSTATCTVQSICGDAKTTVSTVSFNTGKNNMAVVAPAGTEFIFISLPNGSKVQRNILVNVY